MKPSIGFDLAAPPPIYAANIVIHRLITVGTDRDDQFRRTHLHDLLDASDDLISHITVGGEMDHHQVAAVTDRRFNNVRKILPQPYLAAGKVNPVEFVGFSEELSDLIDRQLIFWF